MLYTREWVFKNYTKYNDLIWGGKLPAFNEVEFNIIMTKKIWGRAGCKFWRVGPDGIPYATHPILELSNYLDAPEWAKLNTLVHEMCHLYECFCEPKYMLEVKRYGRYTYHYPKHGHGTVFYEQAERVKTLTGIEIARFVSDERRESASLSDDVRNKFERKMKRLNGVTLYLMHLSPKSSNKGKYAYVKVERPEMENKWNDFLTSRRAEPYFTTAVLCKSYEISSLNLPSSKSITWYITNDIDGIIQKYKPQVKEVFFGDVSELKLSNEVKVEEPINNEKPVTAEKRYHEFLIKFTNGKVLKLSNVTKMDVEKKLREEFPKWPDSTIEKFVNNDKLYKESYNLDYLVEKVLKEKITKYMKNNKHGIEPFSPEEVERLSGGFIVSN
jgi:hypothetical protein